MVRKALNGKKRLVLIGLVAGVLMRSLGAAYDTALGGADRAHAGIGTSPEAPGR